MVYIFNPSTCEASLIYRVGYRTARATQKTLVSKHQREEGGGVCTDRETKRQTDRSVFCDILNLILHNCYKSEAT